MEDMVNKIKAVKEHAVVLDPEHDNRSALLKNLLLTPAIENPEEVKPCSIFIQLLAFFYPFTISVPFSSVLCFSKHISLSIDLSFTTF